MAEEPFYVFVADPDNERGVRMIDRSNGAIVAVGYLRGIELEPVDAQVEASVRFVGELVLEAEL